MITDNFELDDRVRVTERHYEQSLWGAIGTVSRPPDVVAEVDPQWCDFWKKEHDRIDLSTRIYWVVFDELILDPERQKPTDSEEINYSGAIDAGAFPASDLELVSK